MNRRLWSAFLTIAPLMVVACASAQNYVYQVGDPTYSTQIPIENGFINVNNGEIHIEIPIATHTQRGSIPLKEELVYDSRIWKIIDNGGNYSWQPTNVPDSMGGWRFMSGLEAGSVTPFGTPTTAQCPNNGSEWFTYYTYQFDWTDPSGTEHWFPVNTMQVTQSNCNWNGNEPSQPTGTAYSIDGSGYYMEVSNYTSAVVYDRSGNQVYPEPQDTNGNYMSADANGNLIDTLGRTPVTTSTNGNTIYYDVLGWNGARNQYIVTTETVYYKTSFNETAVSEASGSFTAIQSIQLPDGSSYSFTYDSGTSAGHYGEVTSVTLPTGGTINYTWLNFKDSFQNENRWLASRVRDGGTTTFTPNTISLCSSNTGCQEKTTVTSPSGNDTVYTFTLDPGEYANASSWSTGVDSYLGSAQNGTKLKSVNTSYQYTTENPGTQPWTVLTSFTQATVLRDVNLTSQSITAVDMFGNPTSLQLWDFYSGTPPPTPTEQTNYTYAYSVNGAELPTKVTVTDGSGSLVSETTYNYDQTTPTTTSGLPNHADVTGNRGNVTTMSQWIDSASDAITTTRTYDDAGAVITSTDPNGTTTYGHDSTDTFVTSTTLPTPSSGVSLETYAAYDYSSGLLSSTTDANSQPTTYKNYDSLGRVGEIDHPDGGKVVFTYTPAQSGSLAEATVQQYQSASSYAETDTQYDSYGRQSRVAVANGQASNPWYQNDICYDLNGHASFQSYRYQGTGFGASKTCSGSGGDSLYYDPLNRVIQVAHGDGTSDHSTYTGRATETTDAAGVKRITQTDALGRTTASCEISSNASMPGGSGSPASCGLDIAGTGFLTTYAYGLASHTTTVTQGVQSRTFQTDFLGRPTLVQEPESGQTTYTYTYNSTGLLATRTRPRANQPSSGVTTTTYSQYDALGRIVETYYNDSTPSKYFYYDLPQEWGITLQNPKGRLVWHVDGVGPSGTGTVYSYDPMGRVLQYWSCTPSTCGHSAYTASYTYDWLGNQLIAGDGSGKTDTYTYSPANEVSAITGSWNDSYHPPDLVSDVQNGPFGPVSWNLGNGLTGVRQYDTMGRLAGGWVCQGSSEPSCTGGGYFYGFNSWWTGTYLTQSCDSVVNECNRYAYDDFGRLASLTGMYGPPNYSWVYDRWGNRWKQTPANGGLTEDLSFNNNNQINSSGFGYDAAGNLTSATDGVNNYTYVYDAEGNVTQVLVGGTLVATYSYDSLNNRIRIDQPGSDSEEFVFNPAGQHTSSYDVNQGTEWAGWTYWGAAPVVFYGGSGYTNFEHQDWLGTERMRTAYNGQVEGEYTSLPFGDGLTTLTGSDSDAHHFAGLDHDYGTDTDHAQFREYGNAPGRWVSPDPYGGSYDFSNPQSLNRYSYVLDNPLSMIDPSGQSPEGTVGDGCLAAGPVGCLAGLDVALFEDLMSKLFPSFHGSLRPRPNSQPWDENHIQFYSPNIAGVLGLPDQGCEFGACTYPGAMNLGPGGPNYQGPPDVAYNGGFLIPLWPLPGLAGIAVGGTAIYVPKQHLFCAGPQVGVEELKQVSAGMLFSSAGEMASIAKGWGFNLSAISPWLVGGQVAGGLDGKTKPAGGPVAGIPGVSGSISYTWCF